MRSKIKDLFEYRKLPELLAYQNDKDQDTFLSKLYDLQENIYYLDKFLESNWAIEMPDLDQYWKPIYDSLSGFGIAPKEQDQYLSHIKTYQTHELSIRQKIAYSSLSLDYYYYYKSCDVRLLRRLIYEFNPALREVFDLSEWTSFDLITEINDDIDDIEEDKDVINGNGFILNSYLMGLEDTYITFALYIRKILERQARKSPTKCMNEWSSKIDELCIRYGKETISLLEQKKNKIASDPSYIDQNKIILKFKEKLN